MVQVGELILFAPDQDLHFSRLAGSVVWNERGSDIDLRFEGDTEVNLLVLDAGKGQVTLNGTESREAALTVTPRATPTTSGVSMSPGLNVKAGNVDVTGMTSTVHPVMFEQVTFTATAATALDTVATLRILDAPAAGVNVTITTRLGLWVDGGGTMLDGDIIHRGSNIGFFNVAVAARQTSGANLTNNVTAGGTDDVIANYTDLATYANDAAAIRNDIYQLSRKLKQVNDALRLYGLLT